MNFKEIFECFLDCNKTLKVMSIATADLSGKPNCALKMIVDVVPPNVVLLLDYHYTTTYANIMANPQVSLSFMDDREFIGYRMTGKAEIVTHGPEYDDAKGRWEKRLIGYETDRIIARMRGHHSSRESESSLPKDYVIIKLKGDEASAIMPGRFFRAKPEEH